MFKGFPCDSITVPSCETHNSHKSGNDQAVVSAFLIPLYNGLGRYPLDADISKAIENALPSFVRAKRKALSTPLLSDPPEDIADLPDVSYVTPSTNIRAWVRQLTAALVYDAVKTLDRTIKWDEVITWSPDWIETDDPSPVPFNRVISVLQKKGAVRARLEQMEWLDGWSAYPRKYPSNIYAFQLHFEPDEVVFWHRFYNRYNWYAWFSASQETLGKLATKIGKDITGSAKSP